MNILKATSLGMTLNLNYKNGPKREFREHQSYRKLIRNSARADIIVIGILTSIEKLNILVKSPFSNMLCKQ